MTDFSVEAAQIVESVRNAMYDVAEFARETRDHAMSEKPTPFQRAVIGGLVLIAHAALPVECGSGLFSSQEVTAAQRAIAPFLDETPVPE